MSNMQDNLRKEGDLSKLKYDDDGDTVMEHGYYDDYPTEDQSKSNREYGSATDLFKNSDSSVPESMKGVAPPAASGSNKMALGKKNRMVQDDEPSPADLFEHSFANYLESDNTTRTEPTSPLTIRSRKPVEDHDQSIPSKSIEGDDAHRISTGTSYDEPSPSEAREHRLTPYSDDDAPQQGSTWAAKVQKKADAKHAMAKARGAARQAVAKAAAKQASYSPGVVEMAKKFPEMRKQVNRMYRPSAADFFDKVEGKDD